MKFIVFSLLVLMSHTYAFADCLDACKQERQECFLDVQLLVEEKLPDENKLALIILKRMAISECKQIYKECKQECI